MSRELDNQFQAEQAGGYFAASGEQELAYTDLLFSVCGQFGIRYYRATPQERYFVEKVGRVTWACQNKEAVGVKATVRSAFS